MRLFVALVLLPCSAGHLSRGIGGPAGCAEPPPPLASSDPTPGQHLKYLAMDGYQGGSDTAGWTNLAFLHECSPLGGSPDNCSQCVVPGTGESGELPGTKHACRAGSVNLARLEWGLANGYRYLYDAGSVIESSCQGCNPCAVPWPNRNSSCGCTSPECKAACIASPHRRCADNFQSFWVGGGPGVGPNASTGGVWNHTVSKLAADNKIIGVYLGVRPSCPPPLLLRGLVHG